MLPDKHPPRISWRLFMIQLSFNSFWYQPPTCAILIHVSKMYVSWSFDTPISFFVRLRASFLCVPVVMAILQMYSSDHLQQAIFQIHCRWRRLRSLNCPPSSNWWICFKCWWIQRRVKAHGMCSDPNQSPILYLVSTAVIVSLWNGCSLLTLYRPLLLLLANKRAR